MIHKHTHVDPRVRPRTSGTDPNLRRPHKRAIVVGYDNELNMAASGMCENEPISVPENAPFSHSRSDPGAPTDSSTHDLHTQCSVWSLVRGGAHLAAAQQPRRRYADEGRRQRLPGACRLTRRAARPRVPIRDDPVESPLRGRAAKTAVEEERVPRREELRRWGKRFPLVDKR